ncbi:DUF4124 domain-containing protein [Variovorax davisae]|uniref:DUF4124 domain-containing protein n=1 Tax=Variovorax davisae TaxID=3053515 RepID=UPI002575E8DA|nr:DUF4124 domain-containing protein [Variovorax sp. J22P271]
MSLIFSLLLLLGPVAGAEVVRCADAAGNVSYTDGACPAGARAVGRVTLPEAAPPAADGGDRPGAVPREPPASPVRAPPAPSGPVVIDSRGSSGANSNQPTGDGRWSDRGSDPMLVDDGYSYPGYPGAYGRPVPPRDMRPRIRSCDAGGCDDRQGNRYNRSGQLERYRSIDGKTCQPIGTTTVCR